MFRQSHLLRTAEQLPAGKDGGEDANNPHGCTSSEVEAAVGAAAGPYHWPGQAKQGRLIS
jgi:hypothetical protein